MTRWGMALVLICCSITAVGATGANCHAQSVQASESSSTTDQNARNEMTPDQEQSSEEDSSSEIADPVANSMRNDTSFVPQLLKNITEDQRAIWTSPAHLRLIDADWLLPMGATTGILLATDTDVSRHLSNSPSRLANSNTFSNLGLASLAGTGAGLYVWGHITHDDHKRETGFLAAEAALDALAMTYGTQYTFGRERPLVDNFEGKFWQGGDSFPSEHASAAWAIASVVAHEYPGPLTSALAYGLASAVSMSRVTAKQHFPTDVFIGSAIGWFTGQVVYRHHHDPELGGSDWQTYAESREESPSRDPSTSAGSPFVELDSWIYPAIVRLAALGYIDSEFLGMRPWTRIECAQLVAEAGDAIRADASVPDEADQLYAALAGEFHSELESSGGGGQLSVHVESLYAGTTQISGPPLHDSYHFGQTIINDYGRPYEEGFNTYDGFSDYATAGRYTIYVRGEYQHAPWAPAYSLAARQLIAKVDQNPLQPATPFATTNQFTLLDTYISAIVKDWDFSFGKQSLWWGPAEGGTFFFSDNTAPIYMFRVSQVAPFELPWIFSKLGPMRTDSFFGKLSGNEFPARPLIHATRISFKPNPGLELGFTTMTELAGVGRATTPLAVFRSYFSLQSSTLYPANANPGKRAPGFYFSWQVPPAHNWLTLYADMMSPQENYTDHDTSTNPLLIYYRLAERCGIYLPRLPRLPKLDFRVEAAYTDPPTPRSVGGNYMYWEGFYHDLFSNKGNIVGDWLGREGLGFQAWTTYHFNARSYLQFAYRNAKVAKDFITYGETLNDGSVNFNWWVNHDVSLSGSLQYEKWFAPILAPTPQTNWTSSVQITFYPHSWSW
jgi:membrane-associated phospholipid phosphatase